MKTQYIPTATKLIAAVLVSFIGIFHVPVKAASPGKIPRLAEATVVKVASVRGSLTNAGFVVALEKGYFKEANIDIEYTPFRSIIEMTAPIATGQLDVATSVPGVAFFNAIARGIKLRIVADQFTARPGMSAVALMVRKDLYDSGTIRDYKDLKGRSIALSLRSGLHERLIEDVLKRGGLTLTDVNIVIIPAFPSVNVAFANKAVDAGVQIEPLVGAAIQGNLAVRWKGMDEMSPNRQNSFFVFSEPFGAKRDVAQAWMVAYLRGVRDYYDAIFQGKGDREQIISIIAKHVPIKDRKAYDHIVFPGVNPNGFVSAESIRENMQYFMARGEVKTAVDIDRLIDHSLIDHALSILGKY